MTTRSDSIYHKDSSPSRRARHAARRDARPRQEKRAEPTTRGTSPPARASSSAHRYRPSRRAGDPNDRLLRTRFAFAVGLLAVAVLYVAVLAVSFFHPLKKAGPARRQVAHGATGNAVPAQDPDAAKEAEAIKKLIRSWSRAGLVIEEADRMVKEERLDRAEKELKHALEEAPDMLALHLALTRLYIEQARYDEAKEQLRQVLARNPERQDARVLLVSIYSAQQNYPAALAVAQWILKTDPYSVEAHKAAAAAYLHTDRPNLALPHLRKLANLTGGDALTENNLAVVYCRLGQYDRAGRLLRQLLARDRANSLTYYNLAMCQAQQGDADGAVETLSLAVGGFGAAFVTSWLDSEDFDPVREDPAFAAFLERTRRGQPPEAGKTAGPAEEETPAAPETETATPPAAATAQPAAPSGGGP